MMKLQSDKWMVVWILLRNHETEAIFCTREEAIDFIISAHEEDPSAVREAFKQGNECHTGSDYEIAQFSLRLNKCVYVSRGATPEGRLFFV